MVTMIRRRGGGGEGGEEEEGKVERMWRRGRRGQEWCSLTVSIRIFFWIEFISFFNSVCIVVVCSW